MDYYFDENFPHYIPEAINVLERLEDVNNVYSTEKVFGKGIKDTDLFPLIGKENGIFITQDVKNLTRKREIQLLLDLKVSAFILSFGSGCGYELKCKKIMTWWGDIKEWHKKNRNSHYICRIKANGVFERYY